MIKTILVFVILFFLAACSGITIPLVVSTPVVSPSSLPVILSPTPPFIPSATRTGTVLPSLITVTETQSIITSTANATINATSTSMTTPTFTPNPSLLLDILGCNTSVDILHQMGEVTNIYLIIRNNSRNDLTNVCATLTASDEARTHPDKTACASSLPNGYQVTLKLTADTDVEQDASLQVDVTSREGFTSSLIRSSCLDVGLPDLGTIKIGVVETIH